MKNPRSKKTEKELQKEKGVTIQEFKAWLQGITAFQEEDWAPNKDQWLKIKKKIDDLIDDHLSGNFKPTHPVHQYSQPVVRGGEGQIQLLPEQVESPDYSEQPRPQPRPAAPPRSTSLMNGVTNVSARSMGNSETAVPSGLPAQKTPENQEPMAPSKFF